MSTPTAAVLIIGNEILSGRTQDANTSYIARRLTDVGISLREARTVPDDETAIISALNQLRSTYTYVFTTGGIGPTHDDITMPTIAKAFGVPMVRNPEVEARLRRYMAGKETGATFRMAEFPQGARIVWHAEGWAPSCMMDNVIILAGIPRNMQVMLEAALPLLNQGDPVYTQSIDTWGLESTLAEPLGDIQNRHPNVDIGSYPYRVEDRAAAALVVRGTNRKEVETALHAIETMLENLGMEKRAA